MRTLSVFFVTALLSIAGISVSFAEVTRGTIERFNSQLNTVILTSGLSFVLPNDNRPHDLTSGDHVLVDWNLIGNDRIALRIVRQVNEGDNRND